ncbi:MAG: NAD-dependent epimerase/dehydratase family protein [Caldilineales bacterium]|nr:NAD-dependent epimerase/dehydratase family protein [Caldilineales bacterium]
MKILVTGAGGFVGSWLCDALAAHGHQVVGFDVRAGETAGVSEWHSGDVTDLASLITAAAGCDAIAHLAVLPLFRSSDDPVSDLTVNALGTLQVLRAAQAAGVRRFLLTSTSAVYGASSGCLSEDAPLRPLSPYGVSKAAAEAYCGLFARTHDLQTVVLRVFQVFGHSRTGDLRITVDGHFLRAVLQGQSPVIQGDPDRSYDFVHIADVVSAIRLALETDLPPGLVLNIGSGKATTLAQLADWCIAAANLSLRPELQPGSPASPGQWADLSRTRQNLGWQARYDLAEWIRATLQSHPQPPTGFEPWD